MGTLVMELDLIGKQFFSFSNSSGFGQNVIVFGVDMSSSVDADNKKKDIEDLVLVLHRDQNIA